MRLSYSSLNAFEDRLRGITAGDSVKRDPLDPIAVNETVPPVGLYTKQFIPDLLDGTKSLFSRENLRIAVIGTGLTALALAADSRIKKYAQERHPLDDVSRYGGKLGQFTVHLGVGAALFGAGQLTDDKKLADTGMVTLEALLVNMAATQVLKYAVGRERPDGTDRLSFPSGHASSSAALAASISEMYDWNPKIAIPLYLTTAFVGASRIQDNQHHLSDVLAGITLGTVIGSGFARHHRETETAQQNLKKLSLHPVFEKDLKGLLFTFKW